MNRQLAAVLAAVWMVASSHHSPAPALGAASGGGAQRCWPAPSAPPPLMPQALGDFITRRCVGCHDQSHDLDLRQPPPPTDARWWQRLVLAVESGRMPPTQPPGAEVDLARRFPLRASERQWFGRTVRTIIDPPWKPSPVAVLDLDERLAVLRQLAARQGRGEEAERIFARAELTTRRGSDLQELQMMVAAHGVCQLVIGAELAAPLDRRALLVGWKDPGQPGAEAISHFVAALLRSTPGQRDDRSALARGLESFERLLGRTGAAEQAALALCTSQMSGPASRMMIKSSGDCPDEGER